MVAVGFNPRQSKATPSSSRRVATIDGRFSGVATRRLGCVLHQLRALKRTATIMASRRDGGRAGCTANGFLHLRRIGIAPGIDKPRRPSVEFCTCPGKQEPRPGGPAHSAPNRPAEYEPATGWSGNAKGHTEIRIDFRSLCAVPGTEGPTTLTETPSKPAKPGKGGKPGKPGKGPVDKGSGYISVPAFGGGYYIIECGCGTDGKWNCNMYWSSKPGPPGPPQQGGGSGQ